MSGNQPQRLGQRSCSQTPPEVSQPERIADYEDR